MERRFDEPQNDAANRQPADPEQQQAAGRPTYRRVAYGRPQQRSSHKAQHPGGAKRQQHDACGQGHGTEHQRLGEQIAAQAKERQRHRHHREPERRLAQTPEAKLAERKQDERQRRVHPHFAGTDPDALYVKHLRPDGDGNDHAPERRLKPCHRAQRRLHRGRRERQHRGEHGRDREDGDADRGVEAGNGVNMPLDRHEAQERDDAERSPSQPDHSAQGRVGRRDGAGPCASTLEGEDGGPDN